MEEDFPARLEAVCPSHEAAAGAAGVLRQRFGMDEAQMSIVSPEQLPPKVHRNRYAVKDSGRSLQKRQIAATLIAFVVIFVGLFALNSINLDAMQEGLSSVVLATLILAAVAITVSGLLFWRPVRIKTRHRIRAGEAVLVIHVHNISEQYVLRDALLEMGAKVEGAASAGIS